MKGVSLVLWLKIAFIAMIAVGLVEEILISTDKAWWCKDGRIRRGGYERDTHLSNYRR
jgi:hypothetical protein